MEESVDSTSSATASSAPQVESLLTRLRCPATSELARKRKVATNPPAPPTGRKRSKGRNIGDPNPDWWKQHEIELPNWSRACKMVLLFQPSSAAAERVFSLLQNSFQEQQFSALEDYIETSIMLQYNS